MAAPERTSASPKILKVGEDQKTSYCIPTWQRDMQIAHAVTRVADRVQPIEDPRPEPIAVVCFGPSLRETWEKVRDFKYVISCSGAHKFLVDRGIIPNWHVEVDPREHKVALIGQPQKETEYWISSTCHKKVFDHLEGYNVKLWHVFAGEGDAGRAVPPGEWALIGGIDVGQRAITCASFNGFRDLHVFGMDGCSADDGSRHAAEHSNEVKKDYVAEYPEGSGKWWNTTPGLLAAAKQIVHEIRQIPKVRVTFYGERLVQAIVERELKAVSGKIPYENVVALQRPLLITPEFRALNAQLHQDNAFYGAGAHRHAEAVTSLIEQTKAQSVLDYGCGKGTLAKVLPMPIWEYDPAVPEKSELPRAADLVLCLDVLEHIEPDCLPAVLSHLAQLTKKVGYFVIHTGPAKKTYSDGRNAHLIQQKRPWWEKKLAEYFDIGSVHENGVEVHAIVGPRTARTSEGHPLLLVAREGTKATFVAKNATVTWRIKTLFSKEPDTIMWLERMLPGEKLFDVGANMGGYAIWAAQRGVSVTAFEPDAQNFALLSENIAINQLKDAKAYPLALSDHEGLETLYLSQVSAGGSCHSVGESIGPDLKARKGIAQGTVATRLDVMAKALGTPNHIKLDVDGLEHRVIEGAGVLLADPTLKSLLVEVNTNLPEHAAMVERIKTAGFHVDPEQSDGAMRKEGSFKGCTEMIFRRLSPVERHVLDAIEAAPVIEAPYPHIYVPGIFTEAFYTGMTAALSAAEYKPIGEVRTTTKGYPNRLMAVNPSLFWQRLNQWMVSGTLRYALLRKFGLPHEATRDETLLIRDKAGYALGPHTDAQFKALSAVFYLPKAPGQERLGTSLYVPKDAAFRCAGGPHHAVEQFDRVWTAPYAPNSLFVFAKTDNSFHGVEKTTAERDVLIYDVRKG